MLWFDLVKPWMVDPQIIDCGLILVLIIFYHFLFLFNSNFENNLDAFEIIRLWNR